ncbi:PTS cellobiose transporter subunit IIC [Clostridium diolis]|uniref:PTS sugar transporter subunit IIC n=1 Tax=Clostridium diolis TaxID=223919 RepID=UPI000B403F7F|nr:PTS transporter subunit EIIC [Clostridium diolis]OVE65024.1 PTS cellobiose transporter subunit IIC [Clostridium diolis]
MNKEGSFTDKFVVFTAKLGNQIHLRSLRDAFAIVMPLFILGGLGTLCNNVIFPFIAKGDGLKKLQTFGNLISNGTLNASSVLLCAMLGYMLAKNKKYINPIAASVVSLSTFLVTLPMTVKAPLVDSTESVLVKSVFSYSSIGSQSLFVGLIMGILATEVFIRLTSIEKLKINLGDSVPPMVGQAFTSLLPTIFTISIFAIISAILIVFAKSDLSTLLVKFIQEPLRSINTSLLGFLFIYSLGNFMFTLGIHQNVINGSLLKPFLLQNINENTLAFQSGQMAPHIITEEFKQVFAQVGGTGMTLALLIAILIFSKSKASKDLAKISILPGLFEINEPVIFGFPIVFNIPMMIPFVTIPIINVLIAYVITVAGLMSHTVILAPWSTPPIINAWLATAGDWRAVVVQILLLVLDVFIYIPFLKMSERANKLQRELEQENLVDTKENLG